MTRINVIPPTELNDKMLGGELHEITRVFGLVRKLKERKINKFNFSSKMRQPSEYTLGTGHVLFFYTRLGFILKRYDALCKEWISRGKNVQQIASESLTEGIDSFYMQDYIPTPEAIEINKQRIVERLEAIKGTK